MLECCTHSFSTVWEVKVEWLSDKKLSGVLPFCFKNMPGECIRPNTVVYTAHIYSILSVLLLS